MAECDGTSKLGRRYMVYFAITGDCQTRPDDGLYKKLGGFTSKSWELNHNSTQSSDDASNFQENMATTSSFTASGTLNVKVADIQNQKTFESHVWDFRDNGYTSPKLWIKFEDTEETVVDYMTVDSFNKTADTDSIMTFDVSLSHAGPLDPKRTEL